MRAFPAGLLCMGLMVLTHAFALDAWTDRSPGTPAVRSVAYGNGIHLGVGAGVFTSRDGLAWTKRTIEQNLYFEALAFGNGRFVSVLGEGIYSSIDGRAWTKVLNRGANAVLFANGKFVASSYNGPLLTSVDGERWTTNTLKLTQYLSLAAGDGKFIAASLRGGVALSTNGLDWTELPVTNSINSVAFGNGIFVATGARGRAVLTSSDGMNWRGSTILPADQLSVTFGAGKFLISSARSSFYLSTNGVDWSLSATNLTDSYQIVQYIHGRFFAASPLSQLTSVDGTNWQQVFWRVSHFNSLAWGHNRFVAVGRGALANEWILTQGPTMFTSSDGDAWEHVDPPAPKELYTVMATKDGFVGAGENGVIASASPPAKAWTAISTGTEYSWLGGGYHEQKAIVVGYEGDLSSALAVREESESAWKVVRNIGNGALYGLAWGEGRFVTVGAWLTNGVVFTSEDALSWKPVIGSYPRLVSLAYGNNLFVAGGQNGAILTSRNGFEWAEHVSGMVDTVYSVTFAANEFVAVSGARIYSSPDGRTWRVRWNGNKAKLREIVYGGAKLIAAGEAGTILQSDTLDWRFEPGSVFRDRDRVHLRVKTPAHASGRIEFSTNLRDWTPVLHATNSPGVLDLIHQPSPASQGFYRASPP